MLNNPDTILGRLPVKKGGSVIEPEPQIPRCIDPEHLPPNMIYIPPGHRLRHTCPSCGKMTVISSTNVTY